jgi:3alpha(or 20beta)-hydroxysteroid dehydrogenase
MEGKVAIVTGGARGQGAAEARLFVEEGARVVIGDVLEAEGKALAAELGENAAFVRHDVTSEQSWAGVVKAALSLFGKLDVVVNNAGIYRPGTIAETTPEAFDAHYRVNALGVFLGVKAAAGAMRENGGGAIVNTSSIVALRGFPNMIAYTATKWAVRGITKAAAVELAPFGIRVNSVLPGLIDTPMIEANTEEFNQGVVEATPLKRTGKAEEIARTVLFLASDKSSYTSGAEVAVDGAVAA